jgi:hypothetical protein
MEGERMTAAAGQGEARVPRVVDLYRHLDDVRLRSYEGAGPREERNRVFSRAVELLDPVVSGILDEVRATFLDGEGEVRHVPAGDDGRGGLVARWELSWPEQRAAINRMEPPETAGPVPPVTVIAWFGATFTHGHLCGTTAGHWPLQVLDTTDAERQEPIVRAIVEAELHQRIFEAGWQVISAYAKQHA